MTYSAFSAREDDMNPIKDLETLCPTLAESRAEALMLMDNLVRHLSDEDYQAGWFMNGVPDGAPRLRMTTEQSALCAIGVLHPQDVEPDLVEGEGSEPTGFPATVILTTEV